MNEQTIRVESVRVAPYRATIGQVGDLAESIRDEGLRHPIAVWKDGTLISGMRRLRAHYLLERDTVRAVFVDNIEDAARRLGADYQDEYKSLPMVWSDVCRLWELLRQLDAPAAAKRADMNRRRGVELRKATQSGRRKPGRSGSRSEDYLLTVLSKPFGLSSATARRAEVVFQTATGIMAAPPEKQDLAVSLMKELDTGSSVWSAYQRLMSLSHRPRPTSPRPVVPIESAPASRQRLAWARSLPQLEGLIAGLVELGPPSNDLTWSEIGPVYTRLVATRRAMEKMIKQMRETSKS